MKSIYLMTSYSVEGNGYAVYVEQVRGMLARNSVEVKTTMDHVDAVVVVLHSKSQSETFLEEIGEAKKKGLPIFYVMHFLVAEKADIFAKLRAIDPDLNKSMHFSLAELTAPNSSFGLFLNYGDLIYPKIQRILIRLDQQREFKDYLSKQGVGNELMEVNPYSNHLGSGAIAPYYAIINALVSPVPITDSHGLTFFEYMVAHNEVAIVEDLVKVNKSMVDSIKLKGHSCIEMAAKDNHHEMVRVLYIAGADLTGIKPEYLRIFDKIYPGLRAPQSHDALGQSQIPAGQLQHLSGQKPSYN